MVLIEVIQCRQYQVLEHQYNLVLGIGLADLLPDQLYRLLFLKSKLPVLRKEEGERLSFKHQKVVTQSYLNRTLIASGSTMKRMKKLIE